MLRAHRQRLSITHRCPHCKKWIPQGREAIYVAGTKNGKALGGFYMHPSCYKEFRTERAKHTGGR